MRYRYRSEDELKDSGVEWIGKIPKDWNIKSVKHLVSKNEYYPIGDGDHGSIKPEMYQEEGIPYIRVQNLTWGNNLDFTNMVYISEEVNNQNKKSILRPKDILIAKTGATVGKTAIIPEYIVEANTTSSVGKVTVNHDKISYKYVAYYFQSNSFITQIKLTAYQKSAQPGFNINDLVDYKVSIPDEYNKQEKIANFLDEKTSQFDLIISKKEKLIERLEESKKSLINEVVTGKVKVVKTDDGYEFVKRSSEEMRDSGVEWLGEIPKDWEVKYFKHMFNFKKGLSITKADLKESGVPCVSYGEIHSKYRFELNPSKQNLQYVDEEYLSTGTSSLLEYGDFIFCDTSEDLNGCGNFTYLNEYSKVFAGYHTIIARANKEINYRYMAYLFDSNDWRFQIRSKVSGIKVFSITQSILKTTTVIQPSLIEQKHISDYLDIKCNGINHTIDKTKLQIEKLKEAKQSLISEAVTGKIEILD